MKTAREVAGDFHRGYTEEWTPWLARVTAAIEQRDREVRAEVLAGARKALDDIRSFIARYDDGELYYEDWRRSDSEHIVDIATEALRSLPTTETPEEGTSP